MEVLGASGVLRKLAAAIERDGGEPVIPSVVLAPEVAESAVQAVVDVTRDGDHMMTGAESGTLVAHAKAAERVVRRLGGSRRQVQCRVIGEAYQLAGWMSFDQGAPRRAEALLGSARG